MKALELRAKEMKSEAVAEKTGFHPAYISKLVKKYQEGSIEAISGNHYGGNHRNMSIEEAAILAPFKARAEKGEIIEVGEIKAAYAKPFASCPALPSEALRQGIGLLKCLIKY